jgi:hypothetical protein
VQQITPFNATAQPEARDEVQNGVSEIKDIREVEFRPTPMASTDLTSNPW